MARKEIQDFFQNKAGRAPRIALSPTIAIKTFSIVSLSLFFLFSIFSALNCRKETPLAPAIAPPVFSPKDTINLSALNVSFHAVTIGLKSTVHNPGSLITVYRQINGIARAISSYQIG
jgi:hypothetical protein